MNIKKTLIGGAVGLSAFGAFVLNGDCTGYDHKVPVTEKVTWCLEGDEYTEALDFIENRINVSTSYNPDYAIALMEYDSDFRDRIQEALITKWKKYDELDEDDYALNDYLGGQEHEYGDHNSEIKLSHVNDLIQ